MPLSRPSLIPNAFSITGSSFLPKVRSSEPIIDEFTLTSLSIIRSLLLASLVANSISARGLNSAGPSFEYITVF